jgi:thiol-disulfide isomerase/thioredoxin
VTEKIGMKIMGLPVRRLCFIARCVLAAAGLMTSWGSLAQAESSEPAAPQLGKDARAGYQEFLDGRYHRAFAIAPGGVWAWVSDMPDPEVAESEAIRTCSGFTEQRCTLYAMDDQVILDPAAWALSWSPYLDAAAAARRPVGTARAMRIPDLMVTAPGGAPTKLSELRGNIVFLHFWGSWCAPCQVEFPELQRLYESVSANERIKFVLVQSREDIERSRSWAKRRGITMPLFDSGARGPSDHAFRIADGTSIEDRILAPVFPATYVLDSHGTVLFSHLGPLHGWADYAPLLRHAAENMSR